jgi:DNA-binding NarL/FixJ family response regulator
MPCRVFIIEDHPVMRQMLHEFIAGVPEMEVCGVAGSGEEALEHLEAAHADLLLIDMSLPEMSGIDVVTSVHMMWPQLRCLMVSGHGEASYVKRAFDAGASGYVLKGNPHELPGAIQQVLAGDTYLSRTVQGRMVGQFKI